MRFRKLFWKVDGYFSKAMKLVSYIPPFCLLAVALVATINIITTKLFHWSIPSVNDWITYFLIPIVYLSLAYVQLDRGMVAVDFMSSRLPKWFNDTLNTIWDLLFAAVSFYIAKNMAGLMFDFLGLHKRSSVLPGSFPLWPLAFVLFLGMLLYGLSTIWIVFRRYIPPLETEEGENREEATEK